MPYMSFNIAFFCLLKNPHVSLLVYIYTFANMPSETGKKDLLSWSSSHRQSWAIQCDYRKPNAGSLQEQQVLSGSQLYPHPALHCFHGISYHFTTRIRYWFSICFMACFFTYRILEFVIPNFIFFSVLYLQPVKSEWALTICFQRLKLSVLSYEN